MIDRKHDLPIIRQAQVLNISRGSVYYLPRPLSETDLAIMRRLDRLHLEHPSPVRVCCEASEGCKIDRRHVRTLMRLIGWLELRKPSPCIGPAPISNACPCPLMSVLYPTTSPWPLMPKAWLMQAVTQDGFRKPSPFMFPANHLNACAKLLVSRLHPTTADPSGLIPLAILCLVDRFGSRKPSP
jgi:hypothetical protein